MTHHFKTLDEIQFARADTSLAQSNGQLLFDSIHSVKVGQQKPSFAAACDDNAVASWVKLVAICAFIFAIVGAVVWFTVGDDLLGNSLKWMACFIGFPSVILGFLCGVFALFKIYQ